MGINGRNRDEDSPSNEPDWKEHQGHHAKEANEEVGIQAVDTLDVFDVGPPYRKRPGEDIFG